MSSREQYKEALKRAKMVISELRIENQELLSENIRLNKVCLGLRIQMSGLKPKDFNKKWWQFWK